VEEERNTFGTHRNATYNQGPSSHAIALNISLIVFPLLYSPLKTKRQNIKISRIVFHEKNAQRKYKCLVLRRDESYVAK
jgi:hypothetical protein